MRKAIFCSLFLCLFFAMLATHANAVFDSADFNKKTGPLEILRIKPSGVDVPASRQVVFTFNRPVVPVGRMDRDASEIPVTIEPPLTCEWRWLNTSSLACQLTDETAMKPATRYTITMQPGIKTEDGTTIAETITHTFITQRPKIESSWFKTWKSPGMPHLQVRFNQPVTAESVVEHLYFETSRVKTVKPEIRQDPDYDHQPGRFWIINPTRELPLDASVRLMVEPGILSRKGPEPGTEKRVVVSFHTFPEFTFLGVRCWDNDADKIHISPERIFPKWKKCSPLKRVYLVFSSPVIKEEIRNNLLVTPDLAGGRTDYDPWANVYSRSHLRGSHTKGEDYTVVLPEVLKAYETYSLKAGPGSIRDEFGRPLAEGINMQFTTDHRPANFHLSHTFSVLEQGLETELPLVVTNLKEVRLTYDTLTAKGTNVRQSRLLTLPEAEDVAYKIPLEVRKMVQAESGIVQGEFTTAPKIKHRSYDDRWFFSQVTPYNVHVKIGHFNTLVWVTDLATGLPVPDVKVDIYKDKLGSFSTTPSILAQAVTNDNGIARLKGTVDLDPDLDMLDNYYWGWRKKPLLFVRCQKEDSLALVPLISQFGIETEGANSTYIYSRLQRRYGHIHTWGTTAQGVYKAGDTIQFKLYVRNQNNRVFVPAPRSGYSLKVIDPMGKEVYQVKELTLSEFGSYDGEFTVPKTGAVGWYWFKLSASYSRQTWEPMRVLVSDFTPSPFRVSTDLNGELFRTGETVKVTTAARLHAGGPYVNAQTRVTALLRARSFVPKDPKAKGFWFDSGAYRHPETMTVHQDEASIDDKGNLMTAFVLKDPSIVYGQLSVESAVRDDRGKYIANLATAKFVGRDRFVGVLQPDWVLHEDRIAKLSLLVVNEFGRITAGTPIKVEILRRKTKASRVKGAGNAYLTQYVHEWVNAGSCDLVSRSEAVVCKFTPEEPGSYKMTASIVDTKGRAHSTGISRWVVGKGRVMWETKPGNVLNIYPEKDEVRVGEKARYMVQNPFPGARALITVERYGVMRSWVETFDSSTEIIEFNVDQDYEPGFYLSVVVLSPRVEKPLGENQVDLGKPAFRMGYVRSPVKDPVKEIVVDVKPEREVYKPREKVTVNLHAHVRTKNSGLKPLPLQLSVAHERAASVDQGSSQKSEPPMELAVVVLDESVFDLIQGGKKYYDPYKGFYYLEPLDLENFNLVKLLIGRQKFEKKGANAGGDGGPDLSLRSLFKFVSYWNPSIKTDAHGKATIEFELPDNLTGWRVLAMAVTPGDRMGLGDATFKVNRPTEIRPVLPNQVTEGDQFHAGFSVMNRTDKTRTLNVKISATGPVEPAAGEKTPTVARKVTAKPYKRYTVWLPLKTTHDGEIVFRATAGDRKDRDALQKPMPVRKRVSLEVGATYGTTTADEVSERIQFPNDIRTDAGRVSVVLAPSVIGNVTGAFKYMRDYAYICWEQKLTKGVMAAHYLNLKQYIPESFEWKESKGLPEETLALAAEHQAPNGGMVYYIPKDEYVSPYLSAYTAIAFNWLRESGYAIPAQVEKKLHDYLLKLLRRDTMPSFYSKGMGSTVRAVALAALAKHGKISKSDLKRYLRHVPNMSLFGKAHYLLALTRVSDTESMQEEVFNLILSHANETGGKFIFSEELDAGYKRILASALRDNGAILSALLAYGEKPQGAQKVGDIPFKLVRTITQTRGNRDHWENTQENMFCLNALIDYSRLYEKVKPKMKLQAWLDKESMGKTRFTDFRDEAVELERPIKTGDPGRSATVRLKRTGKGRVYYAARLFYAPIEFKARPINSGIVVKREYSVERDGKWILMESPMEIKTGELVRVDIYVSLPAARNFVVVDDPVPGGLEPVNRDLATASTVDAAKGEFKRSGSSFWFRFDDWIDYGYSRWSFYHKELRHHAVRFYSDYLPAGNYHLSYVAQAIAPGTFTVMPLHAEEMYDPDVFGKGVPATLEVERSGE